MTISRSQTSAALVRRQPQYPDGRRSGCSGYSQRPGSGQLASSVGRRRSGRRRVAYTRTRRALVLSGDSVDGGSIRTQLLADIRPLLIDETVTGLTSEVIIAELVKKPDRPWVDWKHGKAITPKALATLLKPFNIIPDRLYLRTNPDATPRARRSSLLLSTSRSM